MRPELTILLVAWVGYFALHSLFASLRFKRWVARRCPGCTASYRLAFNAWAVVSLLPPLYLTYAYRGPTLWSWQGGWSWLAWGLSLAAVAAFVWSTRYYDLREFLGLRQLQRQESRVEDQERLRISPLHRYVRHPWYGLGLALIWTRDLTAAWVVSCVAMTAYFWLGSMLEERKLVAYHGEAYRRYREKVPRMLPRPWRRLSAEEAAELERLQH